MNISVLHQTLILNLYRNFLHAATTFSNALYSLQGFTCNQRSSSDIKGVDSLKRSGEASSIIKPVTPSIKISCLNSTYWHPAGVLIGARLNVMISERDKSQNPELI